MIHHTSQPWRDDPGRQRGQADPSKPWPVDRSRRRRVGPANTAPGAGTVAGRVPFVRRRTHEREYLTGHLVHDIMTSMRKNRATLSDQIRQAVEQSGLTRYRISKETGLDEGSLSKFVAGKVGLSLANLDKLADVLGLDIVARQDDQTPKKGR